MRMGGEWVEEKVLSAKALAPMMPTLTRVVGKINLRWYKRSKWSHLSIRVL